MGEIVGRLVEDVVVTGQLERGDSCDEQCRS